jgi:hypothetical protein
VKNDTWEPGTCTSSLNTSSSCSRAAQRRWEGGVEWARRQRLKLGFGARGGGGACSAGEAGMQRWRRGLCRNKGSPRRVGPRLARGTARDRGRVALRCDFWVLSEVGDDHWSHSSAAGERERDAGFLSRSLGRPTGLQFVTTASGC